MHLMPQDLKALFFQVRMINLIFFPVREFDETMTTHALRVVMGFLIIDMLKMMMFVPKSSLTDDAGFQQITQHPVNSRP